MDTIEKSIKEIVNTGLGAVVTAQGELEKGQSKTVEFVNAKQEEVKKYFDELQLKGQTDKSEFATKVREAVKDIFKEINELETKVSDLIDENYAKLRLELGKYDITLPELDEIQTNLKNTLNQGKEKVNSLVKGTEEVKKAPVKTEKAAA